jgi:hypothetical protein
MSKVVLISIACFYVGQIERDETTQESEHLSSVWGFGLALPKQTYEKQQSAKEVFAYPALH